MLRTNAEAEVDSERRGQIRRWRDALLVKMYGDEGAATRLAKDGPLGDVIEQALAIDIPSRSEMDGGDEAGEPLSPAHPWWGYGEPSMIERRARELGLPWPLDPDPNPYGQG